MWWWITLSSWTWWWCTRSMHHLLLYALVFCLMKWISTKFHQQIIHGFQPFFSYKALFKGQQSKTPSKTNTASVTSFLGDRTTSGVLLSTGGAVLVTYKCWFSNNLIQWYPLSILIGRNAALGLFWGQKDLMASRMEISSIPGDTKMVFHKWADKLDDKERGSSPRDVTFQRWGNHSCRCNRYCAA